ncbi:MAG: right-handed parallel beta-helix repeat-containing protein, partial [Candidatus Nanoarchaeia archaeon]|nr:right-handed parallel beta-helix repeat-containing protein [Candidatus Nanoarchaeia archaeon]
DDRGTGQEAGTEPCYNVFDNCRCWNNGHHGFAIEYQKNLIMKNCSAWNNGNCGFYLTGLEDSEISDCTSFGNNANPSKTYYGIYIRGDSHYTGEDNTFTNVIVKNTQNDRSGIGIYNSNNTTFIDCESYDDQSTKTQKYGLQINDDVSGVTLDNCKLSPNKYGEIYNRAGATITRN